MDETLEWGWGSRPTSIHRDVVLQLAELADVLFCLQDQYLFIFRAVASMLESFLGGASLDSNLRQVKTSTSAFRKS